MQGLRKYIPPFASDQSGAVSVLYELGGIIVIIDAGGCTGNICSFDEPRWTHKKSAVFSATLRDMDAVFGRDDLMIDKIEDAIQAIDCKFIALVGTPVPAVIGTDYKGLKHIIETKFRIPVIAVETNGMDLYDAGIQNAYLELFKTFSESAGDDTDRYDIGIIGATPLDLPQWITPDYLKHCLSFPERSVCYGTEEDGIDSFRRASKIKVNWVVSPAGIAAAEYLKGKYGTPWISGCPLNRKEALILNQQASPFLAYKLSRLNSFPDFRSIDPSIKGNKALVLHQQIAATELRHALEDEKRFGIINAATWFLSNTHLNRPGDAVFSEEDDFLSFVKENDYDTIIGDSLFRRALPFFHGRYISFPHTAVSGRNIKECALFSFQKHQDVEI